MKNMVLQPITENQVGKTTLLDFILVLTGVLPLTFFPTDGFVYYYSAYSLYSFISVTFGFVVFLILIPKITKKTFSVCYYICMFSTLIIMNIWLLPKVSHYLFLPKNDICISTILQNKYYIHRTENASIYFLSNKETEDIYKSTYNKLTGISKYEYDQLPPTGSKIQICGQLSKVGFSYEYIDTVP